jgi:hypothetical protein
MHVKTARCVVCGSHGWLFDVDPYGFARWTELGEDLQTALPGLDEEERKLLAFGIHAHCWERAEKAFG